MLGCITSAARRTDRTGRNSASYFGSLRFKFRPRNWPHWMIIFVVFLSSSRDDCFLPHIFQFVVHSHPALQQQVLLSQQDCHYVNHKYTYRSGQFHWHLLVRGTGAQRITQNLASELLRSAKHLSMPWVTYLQSSGSYRVPRVGTIWIVIN